MNGTFCDNNGRQIPTIGTPVTMNPNNIGQASSYVIQRKLMKKFSNSSDVIQRMTDPIPNQHLIKFSDKLLNSRNFNEFAKIIELIKEYAKSAKKVEGLLDEY